MICKNNAKGGRLNDAQMDAEEDVQFVESDTYVLVLETWTKHIVSVWVTNPPRQLQITQVPSTHAGGSKSGYARRVEATMVRK
jgi:hypothetical protein